MVMKTLRQLAWPPRQEDRLARSDKVFVWALIGAALAIAWFVGFAITLFPQESVGVFKFGAAFAALSAWYAWLLQRDNDV